MNFKYINDSIQDRIYEENGQVNSQSYTFSDY